MYFNVCNQNENWYRIHAVNFLFFILGDTASYYRLAIYGFLVRYQDVEAIAFYIERANVGK